MAPLAEAKDKASIIELGRNDKECMHRGGLPRWVAVKLERRERLAQLPPNLDCPAGDGPGLRSRSATRICSCVADLCHRK